MPSNYPFKWCLSDCRVLCSVRGWCCIFVQIGCTGAQSCTQAYWLGNLSLPVRETAWARKIQTTGRNPLCLPTSHPPCQPNILTGQSWSWALILQSFIRGSQIISLTIETVREIDWVFNLEIWIIYFLMTILSRWNLLSGLIWFPTKPKIVTTDWEFMNLEFHHPWWTVV